MFKVLVFGKVKNWLGGESVESLKFKQFAREIAKREGKKEQMDLGQINEQLRITLDMFAEMVLAGTPSSAMKVIEDHIKRHKKRFANLIK